MNLFQWLSETFLGGLLLWDLVSFARGRVLRGPWFVRCCVWVAAMVAIARPELAQEVAVVVGINRGTDLVMYLFVLVFLATTFHFYSRDVRLQRQLTAVVRHLAIAEARRASPDAAP
jgi:hypothetical protein